MESYIIDYSYPSVYFYEILDMHSYVIHIHMWCLGFGYVHLDMHILYRVRVFKVEPCPLYYYLFSNTLLLIALKFCKSGTKNLSLSFLLH